VVPNSNPWNQGLGLGLGLVEGFRVLVKGLRVLQCSPEQKEDLGPFLPLALMLLLPLLLLLAALLSI
jgi:hypothetical protein